jgi:hypothetical protein
MTALVNAVVGNASKEVSSRTLLTFFQYTTMYTGWMKSARRFMKAESEIPANLLTEGMSLKKLLDVHSYHKLPTIKSITRDKIIGIANVQPLELAGK